MNDVNKVIIVGKIVHIYTINQKRVILTVHTGGKDFPKVFALDSTAEYIINNCSTDTYVRIEGNIQSSRKPKLGNVTTIFVDTIKKCSPDTPPENRFFLSGEILSAKNFKDENICQVEIKTQVNRLSVVPVTFYDPHHSLTSLVDDYRMSISGKVQTVKKIYQNEQVKKYYQNYVADFPRDDYG